jgi:hypothetical protein
MKRSIFVFLIPFFFFACNNSNSENENGHNDQEKEIATNQIEEPVSVSLTGGTLYGNLVLPNGEGPFPAAIIIPGSGPTDRNCNSPMGLNSNAYKMLADSLATHGIASLRYDKRGIGESTSEAWTEKDLRFDQMVGDVYEWMKLLQADPRVSSIHLIGHSEGSLVGMLAANQYGASSFTSIAGLGNAANETIYNQLTAQSQELADIAKPKLDSLANGFNVSIGNPNLLSLLRSTIQPYMMSWFVFNPTDEVAKLSMPTLLIQPENDLQVSMDEFEKLTEAKPDAETLVIPKMNHILKDAPEDRMGNLATYSDPTLPLSDGWISELCALILN